MTHPWNIAWIGIGSNLGDRIRLSSLAIQRIHQHPKCEVLRTSSFYETEPLAKTTSASMGWYVNSVIRIKTRLSAAGLLQLLLELELELGRDPHHSKWSSRTIDLDILFFNDEIIRSQPLTVPHPELHKRRFVLEPLAEISPDLKHPIKAKTIETLLKQLIDNKKITPLFRFYLSRNYSEGWKQV